MKKLILFSLLSLFIFSANAQTQFGITTGYLNSNAKVFFDGNSSSESNSGFYIGGVADFTVSEQLHVQPELVYVNVNSSGAINLPVMLKYYVSEKFNIQAGPEVTYLLEEEAEDETSLRIAAGIGLGYDINQNFFLEARYSFQINNYYTGPFDLTARDSFITIGVGYKFN
ncbi:outer membrane beta-barrel protein [Gaetbulibacter aestuarii]|uniref:Outer membrane beta-barrel protein n=1 Tax=Gaetbulibacter aestuarii TaxID=1502358 RepID=A0ABW7MZB0_9FLAO